MLFSEGENNIIKLDLKAGFNLQQIGSTFSSCLQMQSWDSHMVSVSVISWALPSSKSFHYTQTFTA